MLTPLVLFLVVPTAEPNDAEKLFRQMETKLMRAKTLKCVYENKGKQGKHAFTGKGTLLFGNGNKYRAENTIMPGGAST